jgi:hypothetical protein
MKATSYLVATVWFWCNVCSWEDTVINAPASVKVAEEAVS